MDQKNHADRRRRAILKMKSARSVTKPASISNKKTSRHSGVPLLTGGPESNLEVWKKQFGELLKEMFGNFGKFVYYHEHFVLEEIDYDEEDLTLEQDLHGFNKALIKEKNSIRLKEINGLNKLWTLCFTVVKSLLSPEIEARIKELEGYENAAVTYDLVLLYLLSLEAATGNGPAKFKVVSAALSRDRYSMTKKERAESIADFLERFQFALDQQCSDNDTAVELANGEYNVTPFLSDPAIAMDFFNKLDDSWVEFKNKIFNDDF